MRTFLQIGHDVSDLKECPPLAVYRGETRSLRSYRRLLTMVATFRVLLAATWLLLIPLGARPAEPFLEKTDLFEAGKDGYALYRIPGVVVTTKGTVLAYCEARKSD